MELSMKSKILLQVVSFVLLFLVWQPQVHARGCGTVESLKWLVGDWHSENGTLKINESWQKISAKTFEGYGSTYSIEKNKVVSSETLRLVEMSGEIFYIAKVASNKLPITFKLTSCTANSVIFENSAHDFPQRISYQLKNEQSMIVFVSGEKNKGFSIKFNRADDTTR